MNLLFVCLANMQRSPTAEGMLKERAGEDVNVRSAGISPGAVREVDGELLRWGDHVFVMSEHIKEEISRRFSEKINEDRVHVLGIADRYRRDSPRLKERLLQEFSRFEVLSKYIDDEK